MLTPEPRRHRRRLCFSTRAKSLAGTESPIVYSRNNITLVDVSEDPIKRTTRTGIQTETDVDLIIFALGLRASTSAWPENLPGA
jgi:hypothetical protein